MSRDPLEGVRPSDRFDPADMRSRDAFDQPVGPSPVGISQPGRSPKAMVAMLIAVLCAVAAGAAAFYLTDRSPAPTLPAPQPTPTAQLAPAAQQDGNTTGDVVRQSAN